MKLSRVVSALALAAVLVCVPSSYAQRGGGGHTSAGARGGSSSGRAAPAFRSYAAPAMRGYAARPVYEGRPGYAAGGAHAAYSSRSGLRVVGRRPYGLGYGYGVGYGYPFGFGLYDTGAGFSYPGDYNPNEDTSAAGPYADPNATAYAEADPGPYATPSAGPYVDPNGGPYAPYAPQPSAPAAGPQPTPAYRPAQPAPAPEDAVTLIFKDGRPPLQIHNYALTRTTIYITDAKHRDIPVADLDIPATEKANAVSGVPFHLPTP